MMISPIGNVYGYYTGSVYASSSTHSAARAAMQNSLHDSLTSVPPVDDVPEVFSNDEVERIPRSPEELQQDRRDAYEIMNSLTPRNAEHINAPLEFLTKKEKGPEECRTCENRTYVDGSDEGDVSFQTPGHISPEASAAKVLAHEQEHVRNAMEEDKKENAELVSVSVSLKTAICPECGTAYVAGGETRTTMRYTKEQDAYQAQQQAYNDFASGKVRSLDLAA